MNIAILPRDTARQIQSGKAGNIRLSVFNALIDTGAQSTCITKKVADTVGLIPVGTAQIHGVSGAVDHNNYEFYVGFALGSRTEQENVIVGELHLMNRPIEGVEFVNSKGDFDVLLGMDVIGTGSLSVEGNGTFSFSF